MNFQHNISLKPYNTFGIDVKTASFVEVQHIDELKQLLQNNKEEILILGGGSNIPGLDTDISIITAGSWLTVFKTQAYIPIGLASITVKVGAQNYIGSESYKIKLEIGNLAASESIRNYFTYMNWTSSASVTVSSVAGSWQDVILSIYQYKTGTGAPVLLLRGYAFRSNDN